MPIIRVSSKDKEEIREFVERLSDKEGKELLRVQHTSKILPEPGVEKGGAVMRSGEGYYELEVEGRNVKYEASMQGMDSNTLGVKVRRNNSEQIYLFRSDDLNLERPAAAVYEEGKREVLKVTYSKEI